MKIYNVFKDRFVEVKAGKSTTGKKYVSISVNGEDGFGLGAAMFRKSAEKLAKEILKLAKTAENK
jgi:hypothetical protein